ncbi:1-deoxy-D-xylulose-5-phosphate synthase [Desulfobotulus sp. H1]|uniref:1-deoxy-D-xylulose-5-phosphate synthase n=1 Tax=Desulfobotulus pelophilus TaxID=2823377 RepID=A0ABT3NCH6_9BACT|nr:1-deoxy-D-xylulose-5-phosphate synthase [Desulfobotulus pelophilus]MCW7755115.1 1-deoxy-D-xylulose-5-phosphate synthase [Desulfobotulus pelophilus]
MALLDTIHSPADLKQLDRSDLPRLASEIRAKIIDVTSRNGGHLASSLGAVELTLAIHYVFDTPRDRLIWDVGHQSYAHKLVTGRSQAFDTLRKPGGISGFPRITESIYDAFSTGHSSTSISAGLGMAHGKKLSGDAHKIVAVIGDGSMTAGLAYEALNHAGDSRGNLLVILNDNDMSISPNVGALSSFLSRTFSAKYLQDLRAEFGRFLKSLPKIGDDVYQLAKRTEESFKAFTTPGMLFEAFNFDYFGPINGHRLDHLIDILENIKTLDEPVLLHVTTRKGMGYPPAEKNPTLFHGIAPFDIRTGIKHPSPPSAPAYTDIFGQTICHMAEENPALLAITAAMPEGTGLSAFAKQYKDRFFDVGIAEQHAVTFAAGLATEGYRPVVAIYSTFLQRAYDQIIHDVCLDGHPVLFAIDRAGFVGDDGPTHHGLFDMAFLRPIPNLVIMAPRNEAQLVAMLKTGIGHNGPCAIRYPRGAGTGAAVNWETEPLKIGKGEVLRNGRDLTLLALGRPVQEALSAADILAEEGIDAAVVDARFLKPLDQDLLREIGSSQKPVITLEEGVAAGGFGSSVLEFFAEEGLICPLKRVGIPDRFMAHGHPDELRKACGLDAHSIVQVARNLLKKAAA